MIYERCKNCREFGWVESHVCDPLWDVWFPENGEDRDESRVVHARDAEDAATKGAEVSDEDDYGLVNGGHCDTAAVAKQGEDDVTWWSVSGEYEAHYYAHATEAPS